MTYSNYNDEYYRVFSRQYVRTTAPELNFDEAEQGEQIFIHLNLSIFEKKFSSAYKNEVTKSCSEVIQEEDDVNIDSKHLSIT